MRSTQTAASFYFVLLLFVVFVFVAQTVKMLFSDLVVTHKARASLEVFEEWQNISLLFGQGKLTWGPLVQFKLF